MSLSAVYVADTGHVVGALTVTGASPPNAVASLVGAELPLRISLDAGKTATIALAARQLAVAAVDDEPGVLDGPLGFGVELTPDAKPKPALSSLRSWSGGLTLTASACTLALPVETTRLTPVRALISDGEQTHVLAGEIPAGGKQAQLPVVLTGTGKHGVLALVSGWAGRLEALAVS
ncbi:hypothetical protein [Amycolatopsis silviterrae]|uniref:Uncharacterized protein n=1 Tax=Amycolatopsis silviterrae TaxID=1656914 RepID=A0ABW5H3H2_9PSEU